MKVATEYRDDESYSLVSTTKCTNFC